MRRFVLEHFPVRRYFNMGGVRFWTVYIRNPGHARSAVELLERFFPGAPVEVWRRERGENGIERSVSVQVDRRRVLEALRRMERWPYRPAWDLRQGDLIVVEGERRGLMEEIFGPWEREGEGERFAQGEALRVKVRRGGRSLVKAILVLSRVAPEEILADPSEDFAFFLSRIYPQFTRTTALLGQSRRVLLEPAVYVLAAKGEAEEVAERLRKVFEPFAGQVEGERFIYTSKRFVRALRVVEPGREPLRVFGELEKRVNAAFVRGRVPGRIVSSVANAHAVSP
ncbi:hypothetical protein [Thermosulfurimonas sp. F29]|uniref:hypothetical protein n=1 Tax=Thermosulfurimonas sp. F29 TaxID=2867247 RepID=UPI001C83C899|nr:hypothetical protein [Thermosulfurimonas sp. F29]MBX6424239.1 hypothetical protein [Thermosulfurimonas sp. F29]